MSVAELFTASVQTSPLSHRSVDVAVPSILESNLGGLWGRRDYLVNAHAAWKSRVNQVTEVANGNWWHVWPDLTREPLAPTVANVIELGIAHIGAIGGAVTPSITIPVPHKEKGPDGSRGATKRERRVRELREQSNYSVILATLWQDYAGTGSATLGVWADFTLPEAERNPYYVRFDPRHTYPIRDAKGDLLELLVARRRSLTEVEKEYPQLKGKFDKTSDVEEWFWYTREEFMHILADVSVQGRTKIGGFVITREENKLKRIPAVEIVRPSFDGERRGQFDQTIHILRTMHHLMALTIERTEEETYSPIAGYEVDGLENFGPGAVMRFRSPESKIERVQSKSMFDVKDLIARLEINARTAGVYPPQLSGDPGASIVSARGIAASMGALDARLALMHRQFEWGLAKADGLALAFDEKYCPGDKTIYGDARDRKNPETFNPERDIAGAYEVVVSYGVGAGSDPANKEVRLQMHLGARLISRKRARMELDFLEDPEDEELELAREMALDAVVAGVLAQASQGDPTTAIHFLKLLRDNKLTLDEKLEKLLAVAPGAAAPPDPMAAMGGGDPMAAVSAAESGMRGGGPDAEGMAGFGLPSLPGIMGAGAPSQTGVTV